MTDQETTVETPASDQAVDTGNDSQDFSAVLAEIKAMPDAGSDTPAADQSTDDADTGGRAKETKEAKADAPAPEKKPKGKDDSEQDDSAPRLTRKQFEAVKKAGLDPAKVDPQTAAALEKFRANADRIASEKGQLEAQLKTLKDGQGKAADAGADPSAKGKKEPAGQSAATGEFQPYKAADAWDDPDKFVETVNKTISDLRAELQVHRDRQAEADAQQQAQEAKALDGYFGDLNGEFYPEFGKGPMADLEDGSDEAAYRSELVDLYRGFIKRAADRGDELTPEDAWKKALAAYDPDKFEKHIRWKQSRKIERTRKGSGIPPASRTSVPAVSADQDVEDLAAGLEKLQEQGGI